MEDTSTPDLETLNQLVKLGNEQIRRTFDLYLTLLDKYVGLERNEQSESESK